MATKLEDELLKIFPVTLRNLLVHVNWYREDLEEIRLRVGQPLLFLYGGRAEYIHRSSRTFTDSWRDGLCVTEEQMQEMLLYLCEYSKYAYAKQLQQGFISLEGGIRVGVAGERMGEDGEHLGIEHPMFFNIRIPNQKRGCADWVLPWICEKGMLQHTLIIAPPGAGKTTFLRDLLRRLSQETWCRSIAVIDERYEIAACYRGVPKNDVGIHTDVYSGYDKATGCMQAVRTMAPQILAVDEIGGAQDGNALAYAMRCGVRIVATMHAGSWKEFVWLRENKPEYQKLGFGRMIWIDKGEDGKRFYQVYDGKGEVLCANT